MSKEYTCLGLMSGTSGDGVDASIIISDGIDKFTTMQEKYFEYDEKLFRKFHDLKKKINSLNDLKKLSHPLKDLENEITMFHAKVIQDISVGVNLDLIGFHGQTIYHNPQEKISLQLGNGSLLSQLSKKKNCLQFS